MLMALRSEAKTSAKKLISKTGGGREYTPEALTAVLRKALVVYDLITDHWAAGGEVILRDAESGEKVLSPFEG